MEVCAPLCRPDEEAELGALAEFDVQHDLHLAISDWKSWTSATAILSALGGDVAGLKLAKLEGGGFALRCRLLRLTSGAAREFTGALLDSGLAHRATVEHLVLPKRAAS